MVDFYFEVSNAAQKGGFGACVRQCDALVVGNKVQETIDTADFVVERIRWTWAVSTFAVQMRGVLVMASSINDYILERARDSVSRTYQTLTSFPQDFSH